MSGLTGSARVAGVVGAPVGQSLSPAIHNAWIAAAGLDAVYVPFAPAVDGFARLIEGLRGGVVRGLNVTVPFKAQALALADAADAAADAAQAANLLLFHPDGKTEARNTDGVGLLNALAQQAPAWRPSRGPAVILGAGGAAAGAASALKAAGAPTLRIVNRDAGRAGAIAARWGADAEVYDWAHVAEALQGAALAINATTRGLHGQDPLRLPWPPPTQGAAALDMVYRPLRTDFLDDAQAAGWDAVDGLAMLIGQARPSFTAFFEAAVPERVDVRALCLAAMAARRGSAT